MPPPSRRASGDPLTRRTAAVLAALALALTAIGPIRTTVGRALVLLAAGQFAQFQQLLRTLGPWAPALSIALMVLASLAVPVPVTIIMVANGLVFGAVKGAMLSIAGGLAGAAAAYLIGRTLGRPVVQRVLPKGALEAADRLSRRYGVWAVMLERWIPGIPGDPMSFAAGMTHMPVVPFALCTVAGLAPANAAAAWLGSRITGDVPLKYWLGALGGAVAVFAAVKFVRIPKSQASRPKPQASRPKPL